MFKDFFEFEDHLILISNEATRKTLTRFRLSSHNLEVEQGRLNGIDRQNRLCKLCYQNVIESEYHFLLCCNKYDDLKRQYLGNILWPNVHKLKQLMSKKINLNFLK
jgi:GTPase SAR1 family protein